MKKVVLLATVIGILCPKSTLNAQSIGLKWQTVKHSTSVSQKLSSASNSGLKLNLPKSDDALVRIQQNINYSQNFYPQAYLHRGYTNYYELKDKQLQTISNQKDLFYNRLIEVAIVKLFKLD
jgi:hypothetical protein